MLANKYNGKGNRGGPGWVLFAGKRSHAMGRACAEPARGSATRHIPSRASKQGSWLPTCSKDEILQRAGTNSTEMSAGTGAFMTAATQGHPPVPAPHCFETQAVDTWQITQDRACREGKALPQILDQLLLRALVTRVLLTRLSALTDSLGRISSYDKVILSLLRRARYTSP